MDRVTVIVPNWQRDPTLTLTGLSLQRFRPFETVLVSDTPPPARFATQVRWIEIGEANLSAARNAGVQAAGGDLLAFIDDDAVPEPDWLGALVSGIGQAALAGGPVIGPTGVRLQWDRHAFNRFGEDVPETASDAVATKVNGTNMILRRAALAQIGGFDERFAYFLEETDVAMRLHKAGHSIGWVPGALVHHGFAKSGHRTARRVPEDLRVKGRSIACFLFSHAPEAEWPSASIRYQERELRRLMRFHRLGLIDGGRIGHLMDGLRAGLSAAILAPMIPRIAPAPAPQNAQADTPPPSDLRVVIVPTLLTRRRAWDDARHLRSLGAEVTLMEYRYSPRPLRVTLTDDGIWRHLGGTLNLGGEGGLPPLRLRHAASRDMRRVAASRQFTHVLGYDLAKNRHIWRFPRNEARLERVFDMTSVVWDGRTWPAAHGPIEQDQ
ncbi:GT2 family glycosyltransferase [Rubricella aquisinus]|uniref:GT2 family glycosyltransferase n=1 Tax=Rubricella aquisinus TaxID=2028108 RepID=A0A840WT76_9RHOB|nr:glycosyltransferase [Rubricella aquisinus]MBB5514400.1 GT2 family glycosyltransferase [Rubricella aquisinus]